jgi:hypothetical protein
MGKILPPEFGVLLVGKVKSDLAGLALNHHVENLPVLGHLYPTGALGELDQGFIAVKSGSARQRRAHPVSVEEDHVPGIPVPEGHQDLVTSRLRSGELHRGIVGEQKANNYPQFLQAELCPCV